MLSLDGTHETFEYVRNNHDWNLTSKNIQYVESKNSDNSSIWS